MSNHSLGLEDKLLALMSNTDAKIWGPNRRPFLHSLAFSYNPGCLELYKQFLYMIQFFIPCSECSEHYKEHYENNIGAINGQMSLIEYFFTLHNIVNKRNNKKELKREEFIDLHFYKL